MKENIHDVGSDTDDDPHDGNGDDSHNIYGG